MSVLQVDDLVVVVELLGLMVKSVVDQGQCIHRLQATVVLALFELFDIGLCATKHHAVLKEGAPEHLHLDNEGAALGVFALDVDDGVFEQSGDLWHLLGVR